MASPWITDFLRPFCRRSTIARLRSSIPPASSRRTGSLIALRPARKSFPCARSQRRWRLTLSSSKPERILSRRPMTDPSSRGDRCDRGVEACTGPGRKLTIHASHCRPSNCTRGRFPPSAGLNVWIATPGFLDDRNRNTLRCNSMESVNPSGLSFKTHSLPSSLPTRKICPSQPCRRLALPSMPKWSRAMRAAASSNSCSLAPGTVNFAVSFCAAGACARATVVAGNPASLRARHFRQGSALFRGTDKNPGKHPAHAADREPPVRS